MSYSMPKPQAQQKGIHGDFDYEFLLSRAIERIAEVALFKHQYPREYKNAVESLYSLWIPKGQKDKTFLEEMEFIKLSMEKKLNYRPRNDTEEQDYEKFMDYVLPVESSDLFMKAIMKSIERAGLLPREKVAITI